MEVWAAIQRVTCLSFWTVFQISYCSFTKYHLDESNSGKLCLVDSETVGVLTVNLLACLATCSSITECRAAVYHKGSRTCYRLPDGYQHHTCTMDLVGARLYRPALVVSMGCPSGWTPGNKSCYRSTGQANINHSESEAICKGFNDHAHLADIKTEEELEFIRNWFHLENNVETLGFWTGATYNNGWTWSDGTEVDYWPEPRHTYSLACAAIILPTSISTIDNCDVKYSALQGLCEVDIPVL